MSASKSYLERSKLHSNPTAKAFLELMERKKSNLSVAADLTSKAALIELADKVGPYICLLKTHIDVVDDFDQDLVDQLTALAKKHDFMIFEDRKFADIGNTVKLQYSSGVYKIASWSHITNAHTVPGEGIIQGLREVGLPLNRAMLLLAEMSSAGTLAKGDYTTTTVELARKYKDFVVGFIAMHRYADKEGDDFIYMTPGVGMDQKSDGLGQQWKHPREVVYDNGCDVIIVGRGIYGQGRDAAHEAKRYQEAGWNAYLERISKFDSLLERLNPPRLRMTPPAIDMSSSTTTTTPKNNAAFRVSLGDITPNNVGQLKRLNVVLFPVVYAPSFYKEILDVGEFAKIIYFNDVCVGGVCCRKETVSGSTTQNLYIATLGVLAPYRRLGLGSKLLNHILETATEGSTTPKVGKIYLHVQFGNDEALDFYKKHGFEMVGKCENYYPQFEVKDAYKLEKVLVASN